MTLQAMAYDLRCAMMMFAGVDGNLQCIRNDLKKG